MSTLWLARHAPVLGGEGLCYGASDLPADAVASRAAAEALAAQLPTGLAAYASPLLRCQQLAQGLRALRPDLRIQDDARLREMDFGAWEGLRWTDIPRAEFDHWLADFADAPPAGNGETVRALMARVAQAWADWQTSGRDALWVTHAGVMRAALLLSRGVQLPPGGADWPRDELPFGSLLVLHAP
ncbi:histidine phosphatase family protein [Ottowia sp.]|uniref:histidine phosphatase family protein n=1 Tax=Ottowia sp. TaxID=1898956 RepID=UPI002C2425DB|nr:histidine phosphatase family protein [Ottowia sp.]HRN74311.1 histidine phosphatase family protein [Ottowia sp.]HRQ01329.1 histidine phosphatase family protein [Ottowia sp.]